MKYPNRMGDFDDGGEYCAACGRGPLTEAEMFGDDCECLQCGAVFDSAESLQTPAQRAEAIRTADAALALLTTPPDAKPIGGGSAL